MSSETVITADGKAVTKVTVELSGFGQLYADLGNGFEPIGQVHDTKITFPAEIEELF